MFNRVNLSWQYEYAGTELVNEGYLVCDSCQDNPQPQLMARVLPPDPTSVLNPRPLNYDQYAGLSTTTSALLQRMTNQPPPVVITALDALVVAGIDPILSKLDFFYLALHDYQSSTLNFVSTSYTLTAPTQFEPDFFSYGGFKALNANGPGVLDTGFSPTLSAGAKMSQNSCHIGVICDDPGQMFPIVGNNNLRLNARNVSNQAGMAIAQPNQNIALTGVTDARYHLIGNRTQSPSYDVYSQGVLANTVAVASTGLSADTIKLCANLSLSVTGNTVRCCHGGSSLTAGEVAALSSALSTFFTAVGAT